MAFHLADRGDCTAGRAASAGARGAAPAARYGPSGRDLQATCFEARSGIDVRIGHNEGRREPRRRNAAVFHVNLQMKLRFQRGDVRFKST